MKNLLIVLVTYLSITSAAKASAIDVTCKGVTSEGSRRKNPIRMRSQILN